MDTYTKNHFNCEMKIQWFNCLSLFHQISVWGWWLPWGLAQIQFEDDDTSPEKKKASGEQYRSDVKGDFLTISFFSNLWQMRHETHLVTVSNKIEVTISACQQIYKQNQLDDNRQWVFFGGFEPGMYSAQRDVQLEACDLTKATPQRRPRPSRSLSDSAARCVRLNWTLNSWMIGRWKIRGVQLSQNDQHVFLKSGNPLTRLDFFLDIDESKFNWYCTGSLRIFLYMFDLSHGYPPNLTYIDL